MDCPKCLNCGGQTYRIARTQTVKCHKCKDITQLSKYKQADLEWKSKKAEAEA